MRGGRSSRVEDDGYGTRVVSPREEVVRRVAPGARTVRILRHDEGDVMVSGAPSYTAPTYSSSRKSSTTMPAILRISGLRGIGAKANGNYTCVTALDSKAARRSQGPSVVYEKNDGSGPQQLVYEKSTWAIISSPGILRAFNLYVNLSHAWFLNYG